jgi:chromosome segregation ATPase
MLVAMRKARQDLMKHGLSKHDATKFSSLPNSASHPGWRNPLYARLLAPERELATRTPRTPAELARAIAELSDRLRRGGLLPDNESALAAESVRFAIETLEAEVQRLHRDLDPAESERLDRRLAALGTSAEDDELRRLLEAQRAVWSRLQQRRQEKEARRDRLRDQLVTLWMQLLELDARATRGSPVDVELTGRVRALCGELAQTGDALTEAERLIAPPAPTDPLVTSG